MSRKFWKNMKYNLLNPIINISQANINILYQRQFFWEDSKTKIISYAQTIFKIYQRQIFLFDPFAKNNNFCPLQPPLNIILIMSMGVLTPCVCACAALPLYPPSKRVYIFVAGVWNDTYNSIHVRLRIVSATFVVVAIIWVCQNDMV